MTLRHGNTKKSLELFVVYMYTSRKKFSSTSVRVNKIMLSTSDKGLRVVSLYKANVCLVMCYSGIVMLNFLREAFFFQQSQP